MKTLHLGHHFFGAGNLGDDFMLAGFLAALAARPGPAALTACVPHPRAALARRFPQVSWRPYEEAERQRCIENCDAWLGLGGAPWQDAVSPWFADHLAGERARCAAAGRPMFFLGVGGQDRAAYGVPALREAAAQAEMTWTRDAATAVALARIVPAGRVRAAADLAHLFFAANPPPPAAAGRLTAALNFDYAGWPGLPAALAALAALPVRERVWLAQESRPLPGAEQALLAGLPAAERARWQLRLPDTPGEPLARVLAAWPSGQWLLASRFHATLAGAWAGSRAVVVATNEKLRGVAGECGYPAVPPDAAPAAVAAALQAAEPPPAAILHGRAAAAQRACEEFFGMVGI